RRAVPALVPPGAARGGGEHVRSPERRRARLRVEPAARGGLPRQEPGRRPGRGDERTSRRRRRVVVSEMADRVHLGPFLELGLWLWALVGVGLGFATSFVLGIFTVPAR